MNAILLGLGIVGTVVCGFHFWVACSDPEGRGGPIAFFAFFGALASVTLSA
jgi:hypothetical protein